MKLTGRRPKFILCLILGAMLGCSLPSSPPSLTAAAAQETLDAWNPTYCKVVKFYGFHQTQEGAGLTRVAYVLLTNPSEHQPKQTIFAARFELLTRPDGRQQWFLTSLVSHAGGLSRRQGWDNLMEPVLEPGAAGSH